MPECTTCVPSNNINIPIQTIAYVKPRLNFLWRRNFLAFLLTLPPATIFRYTDFMLYSRPTLRRFPLLLALLLYASAAHAAGLRFTVTYPAEAFAGPFSGNVIVCLTTENREPRFGPNWFQPEPMYSYRFTNIKPGEPMTVDARAIGFPSKLSELKPGEYSVQAVVDRNLGGRTIGRSPGNIYSEPVRVTLDPSMDNEVKIVCNKVAEAPTFRDTDNVKEIRVESRLLSKHYGRPTFLTAAVCLPEEYSKEPERKFPVFYEVPGFGGTHYGYSGRTSAGKTNRAGEPFIFVALNPDCPTGHNVFADSDNNGPWGQALTTELIPALEKQYRAIGKTEARFVGGHSSGGWSSLWLQVTYPEVFGGCWSTSPDPVDFRDFQRINLYAPNANMFTDESGQPRPLARRGDTPTIFYKQFSDMERPIRGEQLGSFEGVFSPRGSDGQPLLLWNRDTGAVDPKVAEAWKRYDIGLTLRTHWKELEPKLRGKIHVYMGDKDTFYLDGAVRLLQVDMKALGADVTIEILPGDHSTVMTSALVTRINEEVKAQYQKGAAK